MPNLATHIDLARRTAERLDHPVLEANLGCFLLGSTSPDIRVITRCGRETYHFATLDFESVGAGMDGRSRRPFLSDMDSESWEEETEPAVERRLTW